MYERAAEDGSFGSESKSNENEAECAPVRHSVPIPCLTDNFPIVNSIVQKYVGTLVSLAQGRNGASSALISLTRCLPGTDHGRRSRHVDLDHLAVQQSSRPHRFVGPPSIPRDRGQLGR